MYSTLEDLRRGTSVDFTPNDAFIYVTKVENNSPSSSAGLLEGDMVVQVGGVTKANLTHEDVFSALGKVVQDAHAEHGSLRIVCFRGDPLTRIELTLVPKEWNGQDLTGAKFGISLPAQPAAEEQNPENQRPSDFFSASDEHVQQTSQQAELGTNSLVALTGDGLLQARGQHEHSSSSENRDGDPRQLLTDPNEHSTTSSQENSEGTGMAPLSAAGRAGIARAAVIKSATDGALMKLEGSGISLKAAGIAADSDSSPPEVRAALRAVFKIAAEVLRRLEDLMCKDDASGLSSLRASDSSSSRASNGGTLYVTLASSGYHTPAATIAQPRLTTDVRRRLDKTTLRRICLFDTTVPFLKTIIEDAIDIYSNDPPVGVMKCCAMWPHTVPVTSVIEFVGFLRDMEFVLAEVSQHPEQFVGDAVDLADIALWRFGGNFKQRLLSADCGIDHAIKRQSALAIWLEDWGQRQEIDFDEFLERTMTRVDSPEDIREELRTFLKMYLDVPSDGFMTAFKFNILDQTLGPFNLLASNFKAIAMSRGFVGFVNRARAWSMLEENIRKTEHAHTKALYLIRFSRTEPTHLVVSVLCRRGGKLRFDSYLVPPLRTASNSEACYRRIPDFVETCDLGKHAKPINVRVDARAVMHDYGMGSLFDPGYQLTCVKTE